MELFKTHLLVKKIKMGETSVYNEPWSRSSVNFDGEILLNLTKSELQLWKKLQIREILLLHRYPIKILAFSKNSVGKIDFKVFSFLINIPLVHYFL